MRPTRFLRLFHGLPEALSRSTWTVSNGRDESGDSQGEPTIGVSEYLATLIPNVIITDAVVIREYYQRQYGVSSRMIAYGAECSAQSTTEIQQHLGLKPRDYILYVSRLEPENNAHLVIQAL